MKRKRRKWFALVLALASGGAAGYLALNYMQQPLAARPTPSSSTARVVVASRDLPLGAVLSSADVKVVEWPASALPRGYVNDPQAVIGRGLITAVSAHEPLLPTKMASKEEGGGLTIVIPQGMRAVSVKVDEVVGVAGFVLPGTRVDVLATLSAGGREDAATRVILQNVQALAAGQTIQRDAEGKPQTVTVITLLVDPEQAEKLTLAATEGQIQLALRNTLDMGEIETQGVEVGRLVKTSPVAAPRSQTARGPRAPRQPGTTVITYNGAERTVTTF
jgi:pilus assembly protein CpaB